MNFIDTCVHIPIDMTCIDLKLVANSTNTKQIIKKNYLSFLKDALITEYNKMTINYITRILSVWKNYDLSKSEFNSNCIQTYLINCLFQNKSDSSSRPIK